MGSTEPDHSTLGQAQHLHSPRMNVAFTHLLRGTASPAEFAVWHGRVLDAFELQGFRVRSLLAPRHGYGTARAMQAQGLQLVVPGHDAIWLKAEITRRLAALRAPCGPALDRQPGSQPGSLPGDGAALPRPRRTCASAATNDVPSRGGFDTRPADIRPPGPHQRVPGVGDPKSMPPPLTRRAPSVRSTTPSIRRSRRAAHRVGPACQLQRAPGLGPPQPRLRRCPGR